MNKMNYYFSNSSILTRYSVCSIRLSLTIYNNLIISIVAFVVVTIFENYITRYIFYEYFNTQLYINDKYSYMDLCTTSFFPSYQVHP